MSLADIDAAATARRIQEIGDNARKAFEAHAQRSAEIDAASREAAAKEEADRKAVEERKAELEARKVADEQPKPSPTPRSSPSPRPRPKPATLSLGAEEFKLDRQARQTEQPEKTEPEAQEPAGPSRTLKLGARADQDVPEKDEPPRKRPPRPEADDDMSGRTWLR